MGRKVTDKDIFEINCAYLKYKTYSAAARETGWSPTTVKKYIIPGFLPVADIKEKFTLSQLGAIEPKKENDLFSNLFLSLEEKREMEELWNELLF